MAGNGDVVAATGMIAALACRGNVDAPVGRGLGELPRLAIGPGGMGAALFAAGEALVDAVTVGLVGNDENTAIGRCSRGGEQEHPG